MKKIEKSKKGNYFVAPPADWCKETLIIVFTRKLLFVFTLDSQSSEYWGTFFSCKVSRVHMEMMES